MINYHLWSHLKLCIRTSTSIANLYNLFYHQTQSRQSISSIFSTKTFLWVVKLLYYSLYFQVTIRGIFFILTTDLEKDSALKTNLSFNPLLVLITSQFRFINVSIYAGITIVSFWMTYLDYTFTYQLRGVF